MTARREPITVALGQMNATVGDIAGNATTITALTASARDEGAELIVFPELALCGYPPEDLLLKTHFLDAIGMALEELARQTQGIVALVGFPERDDEVYNSAAVLADGRVAAVYRKLYLPNYGVFDEQRYFQPGTEAATFDVNGVTVGLTVCEDIWEPGPPASTEALAGAQVIVNLSASPYHAGKGIERERMLAQRARDNLAAIVLCNCVGGQDELVFDGHSVAVDQEGAVVARGPQFEEALVVTTIDPGAVVAARLRDPRHRVAVRARDTGPGLRDLGAASVETPAGNARREVGGPAAELLDAEDEVYSALRVGLRDYVEKNGFERVVVGLSGGIDSSLVALLAVDALGPDRVVLVVMPSPYSSEATQDDARQTARNLCAELIEIPIEKAMDAYEDLLAPSFDAGEKDITEENIQARIRGNLLMALSNKFGWLVLTTGNKSELSVGYSTLYGDMAGGLAVLKDVFKGWVYRLVRWRNEQAEKDLIPPSVIERPPSAELRHEQRDDESLPPYDVLDAILVGYVEQDLDAGELVRQGQTPEDVERTIRLVDAAEHKRRQAPPGIRISIKAFGRDRRLPITNGYESRLPDQSRERRLRAL